jgi:S-DNA-T family DNA segregation ATPase FtsK/SpoIIIE
VTDRLSPRRIIAGILFSLAAFVALSVTLALTARESQNLTVILLRAPGGFLVDSFHLASLYVPAILCVSAVLLLAERLLPVHLAMLLLSTIPFFTAATAARIAADAAVSSSPITASLTYSLGRAGALAVTITLVLAESAVLVLIWRRQAGTRSDDAGRRVGIGRAHAGHERARASGTSSMTAGMRRIQALLEAPRRAPAEPARPSRPESPASLVDLPTPAEETEPLTLYYRNGSFAEPDDYNDGDATDEDGYYDPQGDGYEAAYTRSPEELADDDDDFVPEVFAEDENGNAGEYPDDENDDVDEDEDDDDDVDEDEDDDDELEPDWPELPSSSEPIPTPRSTRYDVPIDGLLREYKDGQYWQIDEKTREAAETLRITLDEFGIQAEVTGIRKGPVITMFEILPAPGVKLSKIVNLSDNIALRLAASSVRIVAPIPGKHAVGIEIPNKERAIVGFAELLQEESFQAPRAEIPIALGKDIPGDAQIVDLTKMPHVLIAGATGSGKSVCVNSIICSILYRRAPHEVKLILIDPKIVELKFYNDIPHLLTPVITDPKRAFQALQYCIYEMERRYSLLDALQVRDIQSYNKKIKAKKLATEPLPYIVVVVDEFADLMATSGKELESTLARLAAMSRAVGIHLVLATQRPSTDVITGLIKANIPSRIAFMVASKVDSRIILDAMGAEKLLGAGDMLFTSAWDPFPVRMQGAFLSEEEVERVVTYVKQLGEPEYIDDEIFVDDDDEDYAQGELEDPLMEKAIEIVTSAGKASASYLQRRLKIGYNRAARMVEEMERLGIVGPQQGSKPREVLGSGERY